MIFYREMDPAEFGDLMAKGIRLGFQPLREEQVDRSVWAYLTDPNNEDKTVLAGIAVSSCADVPIRDVQVDRNAIGTKGVSARPAPV